MIWPPKFRVNTGGHAVWLLTVLLLLPFLARAQPAPDRVPIPRWAQKSVLYLESLKKTDGGYGWPDMPNSHASAIYSVVGSYRIIGREPPRREELISHLREHHPVRGRNAQSIAHAGPLHALDYHRLQALAWLGDDMSAHQEEVLQWPEPIAYPEFYEKSGRPILQEQVMYLLCRKLVGLPLQEMEKAFRLRLDQCRRRNGSFNNTPASEGTPGHVVNTLRGLQAMEALGLELEEPGAVALWLRDCQGPDGGFLHAPNPEIDPDENLLYTWAAVRGVALSGGEVRKSEDCIDFVLSHWRDGGFAWHPQGRPDPVATFHALEILQSQGGLERLVQEPEFPPLVVPPLPGNWKVWTAQIGAPGHDSPREIVQLASMLNVHLWAGRFDRPGMRDATQALAREQGVEVVFADVHEDYSTGIHVPGMGAYGRTSMAVVPAQPDVDPLELVLRPEWPLYRQKHIEPLRAVGGQWFWNVCDDELYTRMVLNQAVESGAYAGINVFHFGGWNMLVNFPWLRAYQDRVAFVCLQNFQGAEAWWWSDELADTRTLFVAPEPTWENFVRALEQRNVVSVRHGRFSSYRTLMQGGTPEARAFVEDRMDEWKWWGENPRDIRRPMFMLNVIRPGDLYEFPRPSTGVMIRLRLWMSIDASGHPQEGRTELVRLEVDGTAVQPEWSEVENIGEDVIDGFYRHDFPNPSAGQHTVHAVVRHLKTGKLYSQTRRFVVEQQ